jgi:hypothetical protein
MLWKEKWGAAGRPPGSVDLVFIGKLRSPSEDFVNAEGRMSSSFFINKPVF